MTVWNMPRVIPPATATIAHWVRASRGTSRCWHFWVSCAKLGSFCGTVDSSRQGSGEVGAGWEMPLRWTVTAQQGASEVGRGDLGSA